MNGLLDDHEYDDCRPSRLSIRRFRTGHGLVDRHILLMRGSASATRLARLVARAPRKGSRAASWCGNQPSIAARTYSLGRDLHR